MNFISGFCLFLLMKISLIWCSDSELDEKKVLILNKQNFHGVINEHDFVLVEFYAPKCGACIALAPEYDKAAEIMSEKNNNIKIAKIDALKETDIAEQYGIDGYPTIRFFRKNLTPLDYKGLRLAEDIVSWMIKRTGPPAIRLKTIDEAEDLIEDNDVVTIGFFEDSDDICKTYLSAAELSEYSVFAISNQEDILKHFNVKPRSIILFNKEYENEAVFNKEFTEREIEKFVQIGSLPLIMEFTSENAMHIFGGFIKSHILLFLPKSDPITHKQLQDMKTVAKEFKEKMLFTLFDTDSTEHKALFEFLSVSEDDDFPTVRLLHFGKQLNRYKPKDSEITSKNIQNFIKDFFDGKLKKIIRSTVLPENWNLEPVYTLVGDNFEDVVMDPTKEVLVEFYSPWCDICNKFASVYNLIGKHYENQEDVIIAKVDASSNEFESRVIEDVPIITLYTKANEAIDYTGNLTFEAIIEFMESMGANRIAHDVSKESSDAGDEIHLNKNIPTRQEL